jgi:hypothetical protein
MYTLLNAQLSVSILDPIADQHRLGSRYCSGGYIYQVTDALKGELLSGPQYPDPEPNVFDGQGAPDMFFTALMTGEVPVGGEAGCIGVGRVRRTSPLEPFDVRYNPEVSEYVRWEVHTAEHSITMSTRHAFADWGYALTRFVQLNGRRVYSRTTIASEGTAVLPVRWFAHPFWPLTPDHVLCRFTPPLGLPENPGYHYNADGYLCRKPEYDWSRGGHFQPLELPAAQAGLTIVEQHPKLGQVSARTDFWPGFMPIWGNTRTFSFEPYFIRSLSAGQSAEWSIEYEF